MTILTKSTDKKPLVENAASVSNMRNFYNSRIIKNS